MSSMHLSGPARLMRKGGVMVHSPLPLHAVQNLYRQVLWLVARPFGLHLLGAHKNIG